MISAWTPYNLAARSSCVLFCRQNLTPPRIRSGLINIDLYLCHGRASAGFEIAEMTFSENSHLGENTVQFIGIVIVLSSHIADKRDNLIAQQQVCLNRSKRQTQ